MQDMFYIHLEPGPDGIARVAGSGSGVAPPEGHAIRFETEADRDDYLMQNHPEFVAELETGKTKSRRGVIDNEYGRHHISRAHAYKYAEALLLTEGIVTNTDSLLFIDAEAREKNPGNPDHEACAWAILSEVESMVADETERVKRKAAEE